ncbi:uracil-DNA glycosylase family protein [Pontibacter fetidus]|uniref:Uracil-DNA glycosylase family protein n=1 Tax=Pontibacter fetidus TaxID=2700082 RepID=A0A6B2H4W7_9BACT|nr:uracil-DNA glycosylase family protein [Pontibacter fetidus]NDK57168.1 uracil-DNA glycosylase family protein [Pontibacter fetidus]
MAQLDELLQQIRACRICEEHLALGPRPVLRASASARLLIVGQAPGTKVHASGKPWDDQSGKRLRHWLGLEPEVFYDESKVAIVPMGFCYPGKGKSGDLPPRPECALHWHQQLLALLPNIALTLLVGKYAQDYFLGDKAATTLTQTVANWREYLPDYMPMPHPSPRNQFWVKHNPWFELEAVPVLREQVNQLLS